MAFEISINTDFGVKANYWRIACINDSFHGQIQVILEGHASEEARRLTRQPLARENIFVVGKDLSRAEVYEILKKHETFSNAIDV